MKTGHAKRALAVLIFTGCIWANGYSGGRIEAQEASMPEEKPGQAEAEKEKDTAPPDAEDTQMPPITDLTESFDAILNGVTKEFIGYHEIDKAFLLWLDAQYGDEVIRSLSAYVLDGDMEDNIWYDLTGSSIHVLWLSYCKSTGFQSYQLNNVHWLDCKSEEETVLRFVGDFNLDEEWYTTEYMDSQANGIYDCISEDLFAQMRDADILLMNNEFVYTTKGQPVSEKDYNFRAAPERAELLTAFGADIVSLANNHVYDYGEEGLLDTIECLEKENIEYIGAGRDFEEASKILYYVANGRKIAFVSATEIERNSQYTKEATETSCGVLKTLDPEKFLQIVEEADKNSDYVIAILHWGTEGALKYDAMQYKLAEKIVLAGADAIIGGHPHRLEGAGFIKGAPIAYSLGNFWFSTGALYTTIAQLTIGKDGSIVLNYLPCLQKGLTTARITDEAEISRFYEYLAAVSVQVGIDGDGNVYDKQSAGYPAEKILYDSDTAETDILGARDIEGNVIDIVGNLK